MKKKLNIQLKTIKIKTGIKAGPITRPARPA